RVPATRKTVAVAKLHVADLAAARRNELRVDLNEPLQSCRHILPPETYLHTVRHRERPGTAGIELHACEPQPHREQARIGVQVELRHLRLGARRTDELR